MTRGEYFALIEEQIQCKKAMPMIQSELEAHIEDQKEFFLREGENEIEAEKLAVLEMGDPVEIGIRLDHIHRPKEDWVLPILAIGLAVFGIIMQCLIFPHMGNKVIAQEYPYKTAVYNVIGIVIMLGVRIFDYRLLEKHIWKIYGAYLFGGMIILLFFGRNNGTYIAGNFVNMCFVPIFAVVIYHFRKEKIPGLLKSFGVLLIQIMLKTFVFSEFASSTFSVFYVMLFACFFTMLFAICKGIYGGSRRKQLKIWGLIAIGAPSVILCDVFFGEAKIWITGMYYVERIRAFLYPGEYGRDYNYTLNLARQQVAEARMFGSGTLGEFGNMSGAYSDYVLLCAISYFGFGVAMILIIVVAVFLLRGLKISIYQKNNLGFLLGMSSSMVLILKSMIYIGANLGILPGSAIDMPFLCFGLQHAVLNYGCLGILLSVHRYSNIFGEIKKKKYKLIIEEVG